MCSSTNHDVEFADAVAQAMFKRYVSRLECCRIQLVFQHLGNIPSFLSAPLSSTDFVI